MKKIAGSDKAIKGGMWNFKYPPRRNMMRLPPIIARGKYEPRAPKNLIKNRINFPIL